MTSNAYDAMPTRCCPSTASGVQRRLAPAARRTRRGRLWRAARHTVRGCRLDAPVVPPCAFWSARWFAKPQGVAEEHNRLADGEALADLLKQAGHIRAEHAAATIHQQQHQPHLVADAMTTRTKARLLLALLAQLQSVMEQLAACD